MEIPYTDKREVPYKGKSLIKGNPTRREIPDEGEILKTRITDKGAGRDPVRAPDEGWTGWWCLSWVAGGLC